MLQILLLILLFTHTLTDCPINPYPRKTFTGSIQAQLNNSPILHNTPQDFIETLPQSLQDGAVNVAVGIFGIEFVSNGVVDFRIEYIPETLLKTLKFRIIVTDVSNGWRTLQFSYFASQSSLFLTQTQSVTTFSSANSDKYSIYLFKPINGSFTDPAVKVFLAGLKLKSKPTTSQYTTIAAKYQQFKTFSTNQQLITYFSQAVEDKKSLSFLMTSKIIANRININFQTNSEPGLLRYSYILYSQQRLVEQHSFIAPNFFLVNGGQYKFTPLQNMNMQMIGLTQFKIPRDKVFSLQLNFESFLGQANFNAVNNIPYFGVGYTLIAVEMKTQYVCNDCPQSPIIFDDKFCVEMCPRGYSQSQRLGNTYCDVCSIDNLKVIDPNNFTCVCAARHYLDQNSNTCKPCRYDCMTCVADKCLSCDNTFLQTKRTLKQSGRCQCPSVGYYDDKNAENIACQKCSPKCITCDGPRDFDCLTCGAGRQLDPRGFCVCKNGYTQDLSGNCVCVPPRFLSNNICMQNFVKCEDYEIEQIINNVRTCLCKNGSERVLNQCIKCNANSVFNSDDLNCACVNNTVKIDQECVPCQNNTLYDSQTGLCVCKAGTFKADDGSCVSCPPKMVYLNGNCECIYNFFEIQPKVCSRCLKPSDGPKCQRNVA